MKHAGPIQKMRAKLASPIEYALPVGESDVPLNTLLGQSVALRYDGAIRCVHCDRAIKKSFNQGYCYPCFTKLAQCDQCIVKPELCHFAAGTCREPEWGETHCMIPHTVYLANSSALKIGITRGLDPTTRWIDQGASQAMPIRAVPTRLDAGRVEVAYKPFVADKTNWRKMLAGEPEPLDLPAEHDRLESARAAAQPDGALAGETWVESAVTRLDYPVLEYPTKIVSHNLDKRPTVEGTLLGIKGQYWILDTGVINLRKYGGYVLEFESP